MDDEATERQLPRYLYGKHFKTARRAYLNYTLECPAQYSIYLPGNIHHLSLRTLRTNTTFVTIQWGLIVCGPRPTLPI